MAAERRKKQNRQRSWSLPLATPLPYALETGVTPGSNFLLSNIIRLPGAQPPPPDDGSDKLEIKANLNQAISIIEMIAEYFNTLSLPGLTACKGALANTSEILDYLERAKVIAENMSQTLIAVRIEGFINANSVARGHIRVLGDSLENGATISKKRHAALAENVTRELTGLKHKIADCVNRI